MNGPFVDRDADLAALREQLDHAREASARTVLIDGAPGMGKTALIDRFLADSQGLHVLRVFGDETEALLPFAVVDQLFRQAQVDALSALDESVRTGLVEARETSAGLAITLPDLIRAAFYHRIQ